MTVQLFLKELFTRMQSKNPKFSLRSFARKLDTDPSSISKILRGHRVPTPETAEKWISKLNLTEAEANILRRATTEANFFNPLEPAFFESIYSWVHPILLECLRLPDHALKLQKLVSFFKMSLSEIQQTISIMEEKKILFKSYPEGGFSTGNMTTVHIPYTTELRRSVQRRYLELAIEALEEVEFEKRDHSTLTVAIHTDDLPAIKTILKEARHKIHNLSENRRGQVNAVYNVSNALYPVHKDLA